MKTLLILVTTIFLTTLNAQDFKAFNALFSNVKMPFETNSNNLFNGFQNEEQVFNAVGKSIDVSLAAKYLGASEDTYDQFEAVGKIEKADFNFYITFETQININNGKTRMVYMAYSLSKTGEFISSQILAETDSWDGSDYWETNELNARIAHSDMSGDEDKILITFHVSTSKKKMGGKYPMQTVSTTTLYNLVNEKGEIKEVTENWE